MLPVPHAPPSAASDEPAERSFRTKMQLSPGRKDIRRRLRVELPASKPVRHKDPTSHTLFPRPPAKGDQKLRPLPRFSQRKSALWSSTDADDSDPCLHAIAPKRGQTTSARHGG